MGAVWGMCTCEQHTRVRSSAHTQLHVCIRVSESSVVMLRAAAMQN